MDIAIVVAALQEQRTGTDQAVAALEGLSSRLGRGRPAKAGLTTGRPGRDMSAAATSGFQWL